MNGFFSVDIFSKISSVFDAAAVDDDEEEEEGEEDDDIGCDDE